MRSISIIPDTDFYFEEDYPLFLNEESNLIKLLVYTSNEMCSASYYVDSIAKIMPFKDLTFLCWEKELKEKYPEYVI